ncbi:hypothetical protein RQP46_008490 [Phenoliferia psychrophenolica]
MSRISSLVALTAFSLSALAQVPATATASDLALVSAQYINSGFASTSNTGFGVSLKAEAILTVEYGFGNVVNGMAYDVTQVAAQPTVYVTPSTSTASDFTSSSLYTLTLADAASLGDPDTAGNYRHYLANSLTGASGSGSNLTFVPSNGTVITNYASPGPIAGTGPHRYAWLLFAQPSTFAAPSNLSTTGVSPSHWNVSSYVSSSHLGDLIAASFFTVENGTPTGSVASTAAVNTATLSTASAAASAASSGASSAASAAATTAKGSDASAVRAGSALLAVGALALFL